MLICIAKFKARSRDGTGVGRYAGRFLCRKCRMKTDTLMYTVHRAKGRDKQGMFMFYEAIKIKKLSAP
jgi:hypothetical protein